MNWFSRRCLAAATGLLLDRFVPEPPNSLHPVAWFGKAMGRVESTLWSDTRRAGVAYASVGTGLGLVAGTLLRSTTFAVVITAAGHQLRAVGSRIGDSIDPDDLDRARAELPSLVGRDPSQLDSSGIAAAVIESVAENSVDAVIAPVFWALVFGAPGACAYRAINTMDAMVGRRNLRYENFGWAAARTDDVVNYVPARLFAGIVAVQTPQRAADVISMIQRDAPAHPSPNAGVAETAMAASIGRELGGPLRYGDVLEDRPRLGSGPRPAPDDVERAVEVANRSELLAVAGLVIAGVVGLMRLGLASGS